MISALSTCMSSRFFVRFSDKSFDILFDYSCQICDENGCLFPPDQEGKVKISGFKPMITANIEPMVEMTNVSENSKNVVEKKTTKIASKTKVTPLKIEKRSMWSIFFEGFGWGFIALLTPCVFPMIPMTVSFFTKQSKTRVKGIMNAVIYGISIIAIYVSLGLIITAIMGPTGLNELSTNVVMNIIFFAVFMVFSFWE